MRRTKRLSRCALALATIASLLPGPAGRASDLEARVRTLLRGARCRAGTVGVCVLTGSGRELVAIEADRPLKPASNMKVLTVLAGLETLGADHEYETRLVATSSMQGGRIAGDLIVHSTGDPNISGRFYRDDPTALFTKWARELRALGLTEVTGDLIADDSYFDDVRFLPGWKRGQEGRWFSAQVASLNLNDNCIDVRIMPTSPGRPARVEITPLSPFIQIEGAPLTVSGRTMAVKIHRPTGTNRIELGGKIGDRIPGPFLDYVTVDDPPLFFAHSLAAVLREQGIRIRGRVRRQERRADRADAALERQGSALLVRHRSSLKLDLPVINKRSQNLHAEVLLKAIGRHAEGIGSVECGGRAVRAFLEGAGAATEGLVVADGSGLSHDNRVTARMLATALRHATRGDDFPLYLESLPLAGVDGTLEKRFRTPAGVRSLQGRVHAKTGYIAGVSALSGYLRRGETTWAFALLFNSLPGGNATIKRVQESIVAALDEEMGRRGIDLP